MMLLLFYSIIGFFAVIGLVAVAIVLSDFFLIKNSELEDILVIVKPGNDMKNIEYIMRSVLSTTERLISQKGYPDVVVISKDMNNETYNICEMLSEDTDRMVVMSKERLIDNLSDRWEID